MKGLKKLALSLMMLAGFSLTSCGGGGWNTPSDKKILEAADDAEDRVAAMYTATSSLSTEEVMLKNALDLTINEYENDVLKEATIFSMQSDKKDYYIYMSMESADGTSNDRMLYKRKEVESKNEESSETTKTIKYTGYHADMVEGTLGTITVTEKDFFDMISSAYKTVTDSIDLLRADMTDKTLEYAEDFPKGITNTVDVKFVTKTAEPEESSKTEESLLSSAETDAPASPAEEPSQPSDESEPIAEPSASEAPILAQEPESIPEEITVEGPVEEQPLTISREYILKRISSSAKGTDYRLNDVIEIKNYADRSIKTEMHISYPTVNAASRLTEDSYDIPFESFLI